MQVEEHNVITLTYELRDGGPEGELMERMDANYPFIFLFGTGKLLEAFEAKLFGLKESDSFEFTLSFMDAYGPRLESNIADVPRNIFKIDGQEPPGLVVEENYVELTDTDGMSHQGKILSFSDEEVVVDFNHAMAGKDLHFKGAILNIRKATVDELIRKHYIQEDGIRG